MWIIFLCRCLIQKMQLIFDLWFSYSNSESLKWNKNADIMIPYWEKNGRSVTTVNQVPCYIASWNRVELSTFTRFEVYPGFVYLKSLQEFFDLKSLYKQVNPWNQFFVFLSFYFVWTALFRWYMNEKFNLFLPVNVILIFHPHGAYVGYA